MTADFEKKISETIRTIRQAMEQALAPYEGMTIKEAEERMKFAVTAVAAQFVSYPLPGFFVPGGMGKKTYPKGYRFQVPTRQQLLQAGWTQDAGTNNLLFPPNSQQLGMVPQQLNFEGLILTVDDESRLFPGWYQVENLLLFPSVGSARQWIWPVEACDQACGCVTAAWNGTYEMTTTFMPETSCHHQAGQTPIDGWVICKKCGANLKPLNSQE